MKRLVIAEKPSVGISIAAVLGAKTARTATSRGVTISCLGGSVI